MHICPRGKYTFKLSLCWVGKNYRAFSEIGGSEISDALIRKVCVLSKLVLLVFGLVVYSVTREVSESAWEPLGHAPEQVCGIGVFCFVFEMVK